MLDVQETGCCGVDEIVHLSDHKNPKDAMLNVCRCILSYDSDFDIKYIKEDIKNLEKELDRGDINENDYEVEMRYLHEDLVSLEQSSSVPGLLTFTGVVAHTDKSKSLKGFKYGPEFAKFIKKNKLGDVVESKPAPNRVNHPTHLVKHWCWTPDPESLEKWYKKNKKGKKGGL